MMSVFKNKTVFIPRLKASTAHTTATADEVATTCAGSTARYDRFTKTYTTLTSGSPTQIASGRFLRNQKKNLSQREENFDAQKYINLQLLLLLALIFNRWMNVRPTRSSKISCRKMEVPFMQYGYRKWRTGVRVFFQILEHWNSNNAITEDEGKRGMNIWKHVQAA